LNTLSSSAVNIPSQNAKVLDEIVHEVLETYGPDEMKLRDEEFITEAAQNAKNAIKKSKSEVGISASKGAK